VAFVHSDTDPYTNTEQRVDPLTIQDRKVGQKNLHIVQFIGTPPRTGIGMWARLDVTGFLFQEKGFIDLIFDLRRFSGTLKLLIPSVLVSDEMLHTQRDFTVESNPQVKKWYARHSRDAERLFHEGKFRKEDFDRLTAAMKLVAERPLLLPRVELLGHQPTLTTIPIGANESHTIFFRIDPPEKAQIGQSWEFSVVQRDSQTGQTQGGANYSVRINRPVEG